MPAVRKPPTKPAAVVPDTKVATVQAETLPVTKRKRLSKVFRRPLDKKLKKNSVVRDCFSFPEVEYEHLVMLKKRLLAEGVEIKKSELVRAGLVLLSSLDDADMKILLAKVPRI